MAAWRFITPGFEAFIDYQALCSRSSGWFRMRRLDNRPPKADSRRTHPQQAAA
jgi:hypothetical protein